MDLIAIVSPVFWVVLLPCTPTSTSNAVEHLHVGAAAVDACAAAADALSVGCAPSDFIMHAANVAGSSSIETATAFCLFYRLCIHSCR